MKYIHTHTHYCLHIIYLDDLWLTYRKYTVRVTMVTPITKRIKTANTTPMMIGTVGDVDSSRGAVGGVLVFGPSKFSNNVYI